MFHKLPHDASQVEWINGAINWFLLSHDDRRLSRKQRRVASKHWTSFVEDSKHYSQSATSNSIRKIEYRNLTTHFYEATDDCQFIYYYYIYCYLRRSAVQGLGRVIYTLWVQRPHPHNTNYRQKEDKLKIVEYIRDRAPSNTGSGRERNNGPVVLRCSAGRRRTSTPMCDHAEHRAEPAIPHTTQVEHRKDVYLVTPDLIQYTQNCRWLTMSNVALKHTPC